MRRVKTLRGFNSILVRLKVLHQLPTIQPLVCFNSILVRLKVMHELDSLRREK